VREMSKAIIIGRYIPPKGKALIKAKKLKKDEGRLTINEAMSLLQEKTDEFFNLSKAVKAGEILTYAPGSRKALKGDTDNCSDNEEAYPADLNAWLDANFPRATWRFPALATEPTPDTGKGGEGKPKQSEPQDNDNLKADWKQTAKEKAGVIYEREKKTGCDPSYASIAKTIEKEFAKEGVLTAKGKRLNADYILRHGLTGWKRPKT